MNSSLTDTLQTAASICMHATQAEPQTQLLPEKYLREEAKRCRATQTGKDGARQSNGGTYFTDAFVFFFAAEPPPFLHITNWKPGNTKRLSTLSMFKKESARRQSVLRDNQKREWSS